MRIFPGCLQSPLSYSRLRDIEAPMTAACYLTEWTQGLDRFYELGKQIEIYRTAEELVAKLRELQAEPQRRQALRIAGQKQAQGELSVPRSLDKVARALGLT